MKRESALELRDRWAERLRVRGSALDAARVPEAADDDWDSFAPRLAVGITRDKKEFRLAIRLQDSSAATRQAVEVMREEARGEVDVRLIGRVHGLSLPVIPLIAGVSLGHHRGEPGTLGCLVRKVGQPAPLYVLSNNHVLARINFAKQKDLIEHPARGEQTGDGPFAVAEFGETVRLERRGNVVDAAIAPVLSTVACQARTLFGVPERLAGERTTEPVEHEPVFKVGKTTGRTTGTIKAWGFKVLSVQLGARLFDFDDQIEIAPDGPSFCSGGDSGSVVVDQSNLVLGLLFSKSPSSELAYANRIDRVFDKLGIELA